MATGLGNQKIGVQLFKRVRWLGEWWTKGLRFVEALDEAPWAPLKKPLADCTVALVTTAGVHLRTDRPFRRRDRDGDPTYRIIPSNVARELMMITTRHYDHSAADRDVNVVLPLDRARELVREGRIRALAPQVYSFMGHLSRGHVRTLMQRTAPEVARRLVQDGADAVVLTPA